MNRRHLRDLTAPKALTDRWLAEFVANVGHADALARSLAAGSPAEKHSSGKLIIFDLKSGQTRPKDE